MTLFKGFIRKIPNEVGYVNAIPRPRSLLGRESHLSRGNVAEMSSSSTSSSSTSPSSFPFVSSTSGTPSQHVLMNPLHSDYITQSQQQQTQTSTPVVREQLKRASLAASSQVAIPQENPLNPSGGRRLSTVRKPQEQLQKQSRGDSIDAAHHDDDVSKQEMESKTNE